MKLLILGDLHGQVPHVNSTDADAIILPGDIFGDSGFRPFIEQAYKRFLEDEETDIDWVDIAGEEHAFELVNQAFKQACEIFDHLLYFGLPLIVIPGNWDRVGETRPAGAPNWETLLKLYPQVIDADGQRVSLKGIGIIGAGRMNGPELGKLRGYDSVDHAFERRDLAQEVVSYDRLFKQATQPVLLLSHNVPFDTPLDVIKNKSSPRDGWHYGSVLARRLIERHHPALCVAGHIHETFGSFQLNNTLCINAGFGPEKQIILEIDDQGAVEVSASPKKLFKNYDL